jgi:Fe2+ transport system protein FeoA
MLRWLRGTSRASAPLPVTNEIAEPWAANSAAATALLDDELSYSDVADECARTCQLSTCSRGRGALVVRVDCDTPDACRLRALGVYEGARVNVVDSRNGLLLEVRGSRIALGAAVAASIAVVPLP